jgi:acetyltransferase-like isoleucine patch superfamily enzyme
LTVRGDGNLFFLGEGCAVNGLTCCQIGDHTSIIVGDTCVISTKVLIRTGDEAGMFDMRTGGRLNPAASVKLGPHVWIGAGATVRPGVGIGFGSIIGERSIVTSDVARLTSVAGIPCQFVRDAVSWSTDVVSAPHQMEFLHAFEAKLAG